METADPATDGTLWGNPADLSRKIYHVYRHPEVYYDYITVVIILFFFRESTDKYG